MSLRFRLIARLTRAFAYHGLVKHPYGREYAREKYTATGAVRDD